MKTAFILLGLLNQKIELFGVLAVSSAFLTITATVKVTFLRQISNLLMIYLLDTKMYVNMKQIYHGITRINSEDKNKISSTPF